MTHPFQTVPRGVDASGVIKNHAKQRGISFEQAKVELKALFGSPAEKKEEPGKAHFIGGAVDDASNRKGYGGDFKFDVSSQYIDRPQEFSGSKLNFEC